MISVNYFQYQPRNTCSGTRMEKGKEYVFSLKKNTERNETDMFDFYEGVTLGTATYKVYYQRIKIKESNF